MLKKVTKRDLLEVAVIMFLLYANVLMELFTRGNIGRYSLVEALTETFTWQTFLISLIAGIIAHMVLSKFRK